MVFFDNCIWKKERFSPVVEFPKRPYKNKLPINDYDIFHYISLYAYYCCIVYTAITANTTLRFNSLLLKNLKEL